MSKGKHGDNSHHRGNHRDGFDFSFKHNYDFFDFGWMSHGGHGHHGKHGHHHGHNVRIAVQGDQWVLTNGQHTGDLRQLYNFGPGMFDIVLEAYDGFKLIAANHMVVDVV